jgi:hypothetical protein
MLDPVGVALLVARAFDRLGVAYFLGGSLASSLQGEPRSTNDIDFVVDLAEGGAQQLETELGPDFDVDAESLREAAHLRSSWNIYHLPSMTKVDLFIRRLGAFDESEFQRRRSTVVRPGESLMLKSPEDTILRKLLWFRDGGEVSSNQWRDVVEVLRVSGPSLEVGYLDQWAQRLGISDLLERAREAARLGDDR